MLSNRAPRVGAGTAPREPFVLGDDHNGFLAVAGHSLRLARQGALDELGELGLGFIEGIRLHKSAMISIIWASYDRLRAGLGR